MDNWTIGHLGDSDTLTFGSVDIWTLGQVGISKIYRIGNLGDRKIEKVEDGKVGEWETTGVPRETAGDHGRPPVDHGDHDPAPAFEAEYKWLLKTLCRTLTDKLCEHRFDIHSTHRL